MAERREAHKNRYPKERDDGGTRRAHHSRGQRSDVSRGTGAFGLRVVDPLPSTHTSAEEGNRVAAVHEYGSHNKHYRRCPAFESEDPDSGPRVRPDRRCTRSPHNFAWRVTTCRSFNATLKRVDGASFDFSMDWMVFLCVIMLRGVNRRAVLKPVDGGINGLNVAPILWRDGSLKMRFPFHKYRIAARRELDVHFRWDRRDIERIAIIVDFNWPPIRLAIVFDTAFTTSHNKDCFITVPLL